MKSAAKSDMVYVCIQGDNGLYKPLLIELELVVYNEPYYKTKAECQRICNAENKKANQFMTREQAGPKQECMEFAEWAAMNGWYLNKVKKWSNRGEHSNILIEALAGMKTTEELYTIFIQQKQ